MAHADAQFRASFKKKEQNFLNTIEEQIKFPTLAFNLSFQQIQDWNLIHFLILAILEIGAMVPITEPLDAFLILARLETNYCYFCEIEVPFYCISASLFFLSSLYS